MQVTIPMSLYVYNGLQVDIEELRFIKLQPGRFEDELRCEIIHCPLLALTLSIKDERASLEELQKTLPAGWEVQRTLDDRYLFIESETATTTWKHPDPSIEPRLYEPVKQPVKEASWHLPPYEALSYCWGPGTNLQNVYVTDSADPTKTPASIKIRPNLATALRYVRYHDRPRTLWVDSICINQSDIHERSRQVKRMGQIYPCAERVIIWIGEESEDSVHALNTLKHFSNQVEYTVVGGINAAPDAKEPDWHHDSQTLPYDDATWKSLSNLLHRPWFSRVWVLQEALSCNRAVLQCGRESISWVQARKALLVLRQKSGKLPAAIRDRLFIYARGLMPPPLCSMEHLLRWSRNQMCEVPHDRIYGLLALLDPAIVEKLDVDYSVPLWQAFSRLVLAEAEVYHKLNMLTHCDIETRSQGAPSWAPNWDKQIKGANTGHLSIRRYCASARSNCEIELLNSSTVLRVTGRRIDVVNHVSPSLTGNFKEVGSEILRWVPKNPTTDGYVAGGLKAEALVETLVRGRTSDRQPGQTPWSSVGELTDLLIRAKQQGKIDENVAASFYDAFFVNEVLFSTKTGYSGVSARGTREGDEVAILLGCDFPMILRPNGKGQHEVVGPCYVHGLMFGEGLAKPLESYLRRYLPAVNGWALSQYLNRETGEILTEDPRLGLLPAEWEEVSASNPFLPPFVFKERETGNLSVNDPRMSAQAIEGRGIQLQHFELI